MAFVLIILCACSRNVLAQWTQPDASGNINNTNTGNVGIGTTTPGQKLNVLGNVLFGNITTRTQLYSTFDSQQNQLFEIGYGTSHSVITPFPVFVLSNHTTATDNATGLIGQIVFANRNIADNLDKRLAVITSWVDGANNSGTLQFYTASGGTVVERLRITSGGNVGLGTASPNARLDLKQRDDTFIGGLHLRRNTTNDTWAVVTGGDNNLYFGYANNASLANEHADFTVNPLVLTANNRVGIGTTTPAKTLDVAGDINASGTITGGNIQAKYQDVAEWVESSEELPPATVVILDSNRSNQVIASTSAYDSRVAGVISLRPGIALGERAEGRVLVATTGRVKVKVDASKGPINIGDLLVTSDKTGVAMKSVPVEIGGVRIHRPGTLIGKALEPLAHGTGEILVLLNLQ